MDTALAVYVVIQYRVLTPISIDILSSYPNRLVSAAKINPVSLTAHLKIGYDIGFAKLVLWPVVNVQEKNIAAGTTSKHITSGTP